MIDEKGLDEIVKAAWRKTRGPLVGASDGQTYVVPALTNDLMRDICRAAITAYLSAGAEPVAWEFFQDEGYFGMWCVRQAGASRFGDGFHVVSQKEARALHVLLSTTPTPEASDE